jgi:hypothetical protein
MVELQTNTVIQEPNIEDVVCYWLDENANYKVVTVVQ